MDNSLTFTTPTPLPKWQIAICVLIQVCESFNINVLFPFLPFLTEDLCGDRNLGTNAGIIAASFCTAQFVSTYPWGQLSDKYGRKPTLFFGTIGTGIGMFAFGLSKTFAQAIAGRLISGLLCGNLGVLKCFIAEITDTSNRGEGFGYLSVAWSVGTVFAPLIGGYLCNPTEKYPKYFHHDGIFGPDNYPYLLPCLVCVSLNLFTSIMIYFVLIETRDVTRSSSRQYLPVSTDIDDDNRSNIKTSNPLHNNRNNKPTMIIKEDSQVEMVKMSSSNNDSNNNYNNAIEFTSISLEEDDEEDEDEVVEKGTIDIEDTTTKAETINTKQDNITINHEPPTVKELLSRKPVVLSIFNYGLLALAFIIFDESLPLFLKLDQSRGGFGYKSNDIGFVLSTAGGIMFTFTIFILPKIANSEKINLYRIGGIGTVITFLIFPILNGVLNEIGRKWEWSLLIFFVTCKNVFATLDFTAVCVLVNETAINEDELAPINALGQTIASFCRAMGPGIGGLLWVLWLESLDTTSGNFILVSLIILASLYVNECLEKHLIAGNNNDYNKESKEEVENDMEIDVEADIGNQQIISPTTYKANS